MSIKIKKKTIKILIALIVAIAIILVGVLLAPVINTNIKIKNTEIKLGQINAKEFENKIIEEIKNTPLNINNDTIKTSFGTLDTIDNIASTGMETYIDLLTMQGEEYYKTEYEDLKNFIYAYILEYKSNKVENYIVVPLFKIDSDNNGNIKKIIYATDAAKTPITSFTADTFMKVLKNEYNIERANSSSKYNNKFNKYNGLKAHCYYNNVEFMVNITNSITPKYKVNIDSAERNKDVKTQYFGIDV